MQNTSLTRLISHAAKLQPVRKVATIFAYIPLFLISLCLTSARLSAADVPENLWFINSEYGGAADGPIAQLRKTSANVFEGEITPDKTGWPWGCAGYGVRFGTLASGTLSTWYQYGWGTNTGVTLGESYSMEVVYGSYSQSFFVFPYDSSNPKTYKAKVDFSGEKPTVIFTESVKTKTEYSLNAGTMWTELTDTSFRFDTQATTGASLLFRVTVGSEAPVYYGFSTTNQYSVSNTVYNLTSGDQTPLSIPQGEYTYTATVSDLTSPATVNITRTELVPYVVQPLLNGEPFADGDYPLSNNQRLAFTAKMSKGADQPFGLAADTPLDEGTYTMTMGATGCLVAPANAEDYLYALSLTGEETWTLTVGKRNNPLIGLSETLPFALKTYGINGGSYVPEQDLTLWYDGTSNDMLKKSFNNKYCIDGYTLLLGNGQLGAELSNFLGGGAQRDIYICEKGLFGGGPNFGGADSEHFEDFATLSVSTLRSSGNPSVNALCQLDMTTGVASSIGSASAGFVEGTEWLASYPDQVIAGHITANSPSLGFYFQVASSKSSSISASVSDNCGYISFSGKLNSPSTSIVSYALCLKIIPKDGNIWAEGSKIGVDNASEILVLISGATNYDSSLQAQINNLEASGLSTLVSGRVDRASSKGWNSLYDSHVADYGGLFGRMTLSLEGQSNDKETGSMLKNYSSLNTGQKRMFDNLVFAFGRYCEIATSRPYDSARGIGMDSPSNLVGIWTAGDHNWRADIHANINVNMNYWPAESTNLSETHLGLCNWIINEAAQPLWQQMTAKQQFGHLTNAQGWTAPTCINPFGGGDMYLGGVYNAAQAWLCAHIIQHCQYTADESFIRRALPVLWEACKYWQAAMVDKNNSYTSVPSGYKRYLVPSEWSPEHGDASVGLPHAQQLVYYLFDNTIKLCDKYGVPSGKSVADLTAFKNIFADLDDGVHVNGGALEEWPGSTPSEDSHRHISHLMAMYPLSTIHKGDAAFPAAEQSVVYRGEVGYGDTDLAVWTTAWKSCLWAQARDHRAYENYIHSFTLSWDKGEFGLYPNLISMNHYPQIDGTFGNTAAVAEMLMQSNRSDIFSSTPFAYIDVAPALPVAEWPAGEVKGLKAQGNFEVDYIWDDGKVSEMKITARSASPVPLYVHYDDLTDAAYHVSAISGMERDKSEEITKWDAGHVWKFVPLAANSYVVITLGAGEDVEPDPVPQAADLMYNPAPTPNTAGMQPVMDGRDVAMYVMFGTTGVPVFDPGAEAWNTPYSWTWTLRNADAILPESPDAFDGYAATAADAYPRTEVNGQIGAAGTETGGMFLSPVSGDFLRLEPRFSGTATLWLRQSGPLFIVDENGKVLAAESVTGASREASAQSDYAAGAYNVANENVKTKYTLDLKGGKTYYIATRDAALGFVAAGFEKADYMPVTYQIDTYGEVASQSWPQNAGETVNFKLNRKFTRGFCHPIVLPFSVSETKMREVFGDDVVVIYLDPFENSAGDDSRDWLSAIKPAVGEGMLRLTVHHYQMLYANLPAYVIPSKDVADPLFEHVTYEGDEIKSYIIDDNGAFRVTGSYRSTSASENHEMYYINNTGGNPPVTSVYHSENGVAMHPTRVWIETDTSVRPSPAISQLVTSTFDDYGLESGISEIIIDEIPAAGNSDGRIYNLLGVPVSEGSIESLSPGIYISRGKKMYIK